MNESKAVRKVRCHKGAVDFFEVGVASEKLGNVLFVPRFCLPSDCEIKFAIGVLETRGNCACGVPTGWPKIGAWTP